MIAGRRERPEGTTIYKSRKGFGYAVGCSTIGPSNLSIRNLLSDDGFTGAVIDFLKSIKVGGGRSDVVGLVDLPSKRGGLLIVSSCLDLTCFSLWVWQFLSP